MNNIDMVMLGDIATWVTAIGTIGAFAVAFKQIHTERHERKKRQHEEGEAKKRAHAEQLSAWVEKGEIHLSNSSHHPMHEVKVTLADGGEYAQKVIVPGRSTIKLTGATNGHVASIAFTDTHGERWIKRHGEGLANAHSGEVKAK